MTTQEPDRIKIENIDIQATIEKAQSLIREDKQLSAATKSMFEILILVITLLANRLNLNSTNSSKPPSSDPNRIKPTRKKTGKKPGGQNGHVGTTLQKVENPDRVKEIKVDRRKLPAGRYRQDGFEARQVFDIDISRVVTEYRAQILKDDEGNRFVAQFPKGVTKAVQYGTGFKAHSVYMSQFQLIPYNKIQDHFSDQLHIPVSEGSIFNFNKEAFGLLDDFEKRVKQQLTASDMAHADKTGVNIGGVSDIGCIAYPMRPGLFIIPTKKGVWKPSMIWGCCLGSKGCCAMTIGSPAISSIVPTLCATHII